MASQVACGNEPLEVFEFKSFIRGYHAYQDLWSPQLGDMLSIKREPTNLEDKFAVAVKLEDWQCYWQRTFVNFPVQVLFVSAINKVGLM